MIGTEAACEVSRFATPQRHDAGMSIDAARAFNRACPPGTVIEVALRDGTTRTGTLRRPAFVWSGLALVEVDGWPGYYTVQAVEP